LDFIVFSSLTIVESSKLDLTVHVKHLAHRACSQTFGSARLIIFHSISFAQSNRKGTVPSWSESLLRGLVNRRITDEFNGSGSTSNLHP
jgi:hypothetical protein